MSWTEEIIFADLPHYRRPRYYRCNCGYFQTVDQHNIIASNSLQERFRAELLDIEDTYKGGPVCAKVTVALICAKSHNLYGVEVVVCGDGPQWSDGYIESFDHLKVVETFGKKTKFSCGILHKVKKDDICTSISELLSRSVEKQSIGKYGPFCSSMFVPVKCKKCDQFFKVKVGLEADVPFQGRKRSHSMIYRFTNVKLVEIFTMFDGSEEEGDTEFGCVELEDVKEILEQNDFIFSVRVIAKTAMHGGFCHLAFDAKRGRFIRPIYHTNEGVCCWENELQLGACYDFMVQTLPPEVPVKLTPLPHQNDDLLFFCGGDSNEKVTMADMFYELKKVVKPRITEICGEAIYDRQYLLEGTNCNSAGVLACNGGKIRIFNDERGKRRIQLGEYTLPVTAMDEFPDIFAKGLVLVVLGLGRPFSGTGNCYFNPRRCYLLALNIIPKPQEI